MQWRNSHKAKCTKICTSEWTIQSWIRNPACWGALPKLLCSSTISSFFRAYTTVAFWEILCGMEGYCGRLWRKHGVAMEFPAGGGTCVLYLHYTHCSSIACCQGVGQFEKSVNVAEVDAKKCCWETWKSELVQRKTVSYVSWVYM